MTRREIQPGCQFASDNTAGICPEAWESLERANVDSASPYGEDEWTAKATALIREFFETDCEVFFTFNGTAANSLALASLCQPYHSVIAHEISHVVTDECGGPEFFSGGSRLLKVGGEQGCVDCDEVSNLVRQRTDVHFPKAKVLSITQSTEMGTVYDLDAIDRIHETVQRLNLHLHIDGARFANALCALKLPPKELTWKRGADVLCLGGTKVGMAVGDCVVFFNKDLANEFEYRCKQSGQLASKMRYLTAPWVGMIESGALLDCANHANEMAKTLSRELAAIDGVRIIAPTMANAVFVEFGDVARKALRDRGWEFYEFFGDTTSRLMCSWATSVQEIDALVHDVETEMRRAQK